MVWSGKRWPVLKIVAKAWEYLSQWNDTQNRIVAHLTPSLAGDGAVVWAKPQQNEVKISVDAAVFQELGM